jgi:predicted lipid-binding transport protein (Tim44 family)
LRAQYSNTRIGRKARNARSGAGAGEGRREAALLLRRRPTRAAAGQQTDIATLNGELLEVVTEGGTHWASVRFSGMLREDPGVAPQAFAEVWNLQKSAQGDSGWLLAGIQQVS